MKVLGYIKDQAPGSISRYLPDFIADGIEDVDFARLREEGITHILLDLDLTLRKAYSRNLDEHVIATFQDIQANGWFKTISIVSNNSRNLQKYATPIGARIFQPFWAGLWLIRKPNPLFFQRVMKELDIQPRQAVMIGDKLRTDIAGAHKVGIRTVLLKPMGIDYWFDHLLLARLRERWYYKRALEAQQRHQHRS